MPFRRTTVVALTAVILALSPTLVHAAPAKKSFRVSAAPSTAALPAGGGAVTVTGKVSPSGKKRPVSLQVAVGGGWVTIASGKTDKKKATYALTGSVTTAGVNTLRVTTPKKGSRQAGTSAPFVVTVAAPVTGGGPGVPSGPAWKSVSTANSHSCGVTDTGAAKCWGLNDHGQLGNITNLGSTTTPNYAPLAAGDGSVRTWVSVAAGHFHTCGLRSDGQVLCWGSNQNSQLGPNATAGADKVTTPVAVPGTYRAVSSGQYHSCAITTANKLYCWGSNAYGQLGYATSSNGDSATPQEVVTAGKPTATWSSVDTSLVNTCGVQTDGTAWCWGSNGNAQLGSGAAKDNLVHNAPVQVLESGWTSISSGYVHTCGLRGGAAYCWGWNYYGQLGSTTGNGSGTTFVTSPTQVGTETAWTSIAVGNQFTCATKAAGTMWCWGFNSSSRLAINPSDMNAHPNPVPILAGTTDWSAPEAGEAQTCAFRSGKPWCWGRNSSGQLGNSSVSEYGGPVAVSAPAG